MAENGTTKTHVRIRLRCQIKMIVLLLPNLILLSLEKDELNNLNEKCTTIISVCLNEIHNNSYLCNLWVKDFTVLNEAYRVRQVY